ncbi:hypothetical protein FRB94_001754 [Tulasnella sp. JGI-2019a]|nr:hypothetical protein FRB93_002030 [Tulasnella sp. JGI-2019a]KAG9005206.1 hypothetical protein FRB94_001754 [Tulasnella sp. JGI-2019a]
MDTLDESHIALRTALESLGAYRIEYDHLQIDMESEIGQGGFGTVRRGRFREQAVAVKCLRSDASQDVRVAKRLVREMKIWSGLRHENVLALIGFYLSQTLDVALIVCPIAPHGSLRDYVRREKPSQMCRLRLALDTLKGLVYLHSLRPPVVHGDIKAANALVNQDTRAVLSDFGLAIAASEVPSGLTTSRGLVGSLRWWSPELFDDNPPSTASDIWAWGSLLVEVMKECVPYSWIEDDVSVVKAIMKGALPESRGKLRSPLDLWSVTKICWQVDQAKRATGNTVLRNMMTLIGSVEKSGRAGEITPTPGVTVSTVPQSAVHHQEASRSDDSRRYNALINLAWRLYTRFQASEHHEDLHAAITHQQEALRLEPPKDYDISAAPHIMALYMHARFKADGNRADLDAAITYQQQTLHLRPPGHIHRAASVENMAIYLNARFTSDKNRTDLDAAFTHQQEALQLRPPGHPDRSSTVHRMALLTHARFIEDKNRADLDAAIMYQQEALQLRPPEHHDRSSTVHCMAVYLYARYKEDGTRADLDAAITYQQEALQLRPPGHSDRFISVQSMVIYVNARFTNYGNLTDLDAAIAYQEEELQLLSPNQPEP